MPQIFSDVESRQFFETLKEMILSLLLLKCCYCYLVNYFVNFGYFCLLLVKPWLGDWGACENGVFLVLQEGFRKALSTAYFRMLLGLPVFKGCCRYIVNYFVYFGCFGLLLVMPLLDEWGACEIEGPSWFLEL